MRTQVEFSTDPNSMHCGRRLFYFPEKKRCGCINDIDNQGVGLNVVPKSGFIEYFLILGKFTFYEIKF